MRIPPAARPLPNSASTKTSTKASTSATSAEASTSTSTKTAALAIGALRGVSLAPAVADALAFARTAHGDQRYGDEPYQVHLEEVMRGCLRLGFDDETSLKAAALHDVLEDTDVGAAAIAAHFQTPARGGDGARLAQIVRELSHDRGVDTVDYLAAMSDAAFRVKLADRLANVERMGLLQNSPDRAAYLLAKYGPEMALFAAEAARRGMNAPFAVLAAAMAQTTAAIEGAVSAYELAEGRARVAEKERAKEQERAKALAGSGADGSAAASAHVAAMGGKSALSAQPAMFAVRPPK